MSDRYEEFRDRVRLIHRLGGGMALLGWDQEVCMPPAGARARAGSRAALATVIHEKMVDSRLGELLDALSGEVQEPMAAANVREMKRLRDRAVRVPGTLVAEIAETAAMAQQDWARARDEDDWARFAPHLEKLVDLKRREADAIGFATEPYDALIEEFEPGARVAELLPVFTALRGHLIDLQARLRGAAAPPVDDLLHGQFPIDRQVELGHRVLAAIGFDFEGGRLDVSAHPFTEAMGVGDVRVTSRYDETDLALGLYANLHEGGHALYEMGLPVEFREEPVAQAVSLGMHESQSRLWENHVGRSRSFCHWVSPLLIELFPDRFGALSTDELYRAANVVRPTLIRIEADEVTYNLHIILRLEIERALIGGEIEAAAVPTVWRERTRDTLDLEPTTDREGALQDIHWSTGAFGYFPTYTLGNLYAAQLWEAAGRALPDLATEIAGGDFAPLLGWLRDNVHRPGSLYNAAELCRRATGEALSAEPFVRHLTGKFGEVYGL